MHKLYQPNIYLAKSRETTFAVTWVSRKPTAENILPRDRLQASACGDIIT